MRGKDTLINEVLVFCKCWLCQRDTQTEWQERNKGRKGEGEGLISNRNKILRKQACCQPELALPYCLAVGVCMPYTSACMCVDLCAFVCMCKSLPAHVPDEPLCPFIRLLCVSSELIDTLFLSVCHSLYVCVFVHVCNTSLSSQDPMLNSASLRSSNVMSGHVWCCL